MIINITSLQSSHENTIDYHHTQKRLTNKHKIQLTPYLEIRNDLIMSLNLTPDTKSIIIINVYYC